jgi:hypothetical protein
MFHVARFIFQMFFGILLGVGAIIMVLCLLYVILKLLGMSMGISI